MNHSVLKTIGLVWLIALGASSTPSLAGYYDGNHLNIPSNSYQNIPRNIPCNLYHSGC